MSIEAKEVSPLKLINATYVNITLFYFVLAYKKYMRK
jgi:hypothetical protein